MPTWVTPFSSNQARRAARSWCMVPKVRVSRNDRRPAAPTITQATTEPWCTSSPAAHSMSASIATSQGGGRDAAGRKTEADPRAGRTSRSRPSIVPERGADRSLVRGRMPPATTGLHASTGPNVGQAPPSSQPHFHPAVVRRGRWGSLVGFRGGGKNASRDETANEGTEQGFAAATGVMRELEEAEI